MTAIGHRPLWIARLAGTQEEMGRQHGELLRRAGGYDAALDHYPDMPERMLFGDAPRAVRAIAGAVANAALRRLERDRPPELRARSEAFIRALGRDVSYTKYLAVMDVMQNAVGLASRLGAGPFGRRSRRAAAAMTRAAQPACSTVVVWGAASTDGELRHARNFDFPGNGVWDAAPTLVLCAPAGGMRYGFVATRGADAPVVSVWNEAGLTFTSHTRFHRQVRWSGAAIVDLMHALGARAETLADARAIAGERPSASTWGICASSARERRAIVLELHGGAVRAIEPAAGAELLTCANRYRDPHMQDGEATASHAWAMHSDARERRLRELATERARAGGADTAALCRMLGDRIDPHAPGVIRRAGGVIAQAINVHAIVVEPERASAVIAVGPAPAVDGPWLRVAWRWDGPVGAWELPALSPDAGFTVAPFEPAPGTARDAASEHLAEVARLEQTTHDAAAMIAAIDRAIAIAPDDPSLRLIALWIHQRRGDHARGAAEAAAGLALETIAYRRGQLLLWGARAAASAGDRARAIAWRDELDRMREPELDELRVRARADARRKVSASRRPEASLFMADAH